MTIPENVSINHIQASIFSFLYKIFPHLQTQKKKNIKFKQKKQNPFVLCNQDSFFYLRGASWVMNGAREEDSTVAIDDDSFLIISHTTTLYHAGSNQHCC